MNRLSLQKVITVAFILLFLWGCKTLAITSRTPVPPPTPSLTTAPPVPSTPIPPTATSLGEGPVLLKKFDTVYIGGTIYGHGKAAVILASRGGYSQYEWSTFAMVLADEGYTALTLGSSDGEGATVEYVQYAGEFLRANGFKQIACIGVSNGTSGCAFNVHQPELIALVLITYHGHADLTNITYPKMFIAGELSGYKNSTEKGYKVLLNPKLL